MNKVYSGCQELTFRDDVTYDIMIFDRISQNYEIISTIHQKIL